tara:strand:+ start:15543 stop:16178 length:636 start_codon:yes stop_codon:yes gene_type:complete
MSNEELAVEFEIIFEDLDTNGSKGLDNFERSTCFTHAQEALVKQKALANDLHSIRSIIDTNTLAGIGPGSYPGSRLFPAIDVFVMLDQHLVDGIGGTLPVTLVGPEIIKSMYLSAYKFPPKNIAYMLYGEDIVEVFAPLNFSLDKYFRRVVKYPSPVILETLSGTDTINGLQAQTSPVVDDDEHRLLVEMAVQFAVKTYIGVPEQQVPKSQ